ncbi:hypothetical protein, partial [Anaerovibrio sp.]|uniref:hypothetical protein n=1 Tax=Anaerovibrio sp. TaxID=1872532 RepID=UPI003F17D029
MEMNTGNRGNFDHKGKKANRNRKLALLAGMALSFGVAYGMMPGEVALAYKHLLDVTGGTYKVVFFWTDTTEEFTETYNTFS